ncbi:glutathione S-transferase [Prosthecomicrobium pneumaticum]|uniref:Glutathione S-transferase n=1 Tax=Prosthecomicrobium pneumaticum TaxID=81895 RepID=A0A7W9CU76_9HYPH|nr:glutathione S-transferase [Prosthecomicrobium pneumaticum]MBB5752000.1 glutathione S-transferase [Prosthecomicrobium pneumaticum]
MTDFTLVVGSREWSSWSLRPYFAICHTPAAFDVTLIALRTPETAARIRSVSPSGFVPLLIDRRFATPLKVWDSLAICEYLAECFPQAQLWPADPAARAVARSVSAEMHSGFRALRTNLPMDLFAEKPGVGLDAEGVADDIARIETLWRDCRTAYGAAGPYLFGAPTIADAMFAPVASRFRTYRPALGEIAAAYVETLLADPAFRDWETAARRESHISQA